jgi:hypothetical protein
MTNSWNQIFYHARCKLFIYYRPTLEMPANGTRFTAIIENDEKNFKVIDNSLYELDFSTTGEILIPMFQRDEWAQKWKMTWPLYNFIKG